MILLTSINLYLECLMQQLTKYSNKSKIYTIFYDTYDKSRNTDVTIRLL